MLSTSSESSPHVGVIPLTGRQKRDRREIGCWMFLTGLMDPMPSSSSRSNQSPGLSPSPPLPRQKFREKAGLVMVSGNGQGCSVWYTAVVLPSPSTVLAIDGLPSFPTTARGVDITNDVLRSLWLQPEISKSDILL